MNNSDGNNKGGDKNNDDNDNSDDDKKDKTLVLLKNMTQNTDFGMVAKYEYDP